ncbi:MAG TPA: tannase/feruloyl esterase family alpha/beta hydrolase [Acidobacteriaceae bacterium]|jgi:feruloyl esterase
MKLIRTHSAIVSVMSGLALFCLCVSAHAAETTKCEALAKLSLPGATIDKARFVEAGAFVLPPGSIDTHAQATLSVLPHSYASLPSFCRLEATLRPTSESDIKVEVWMPESGWNNKFNVVGNGGWAGSIRYADMAVSMYAGYATASTDTGHQGNSGVFGFGHPEKLTDYSYRAIHEMTVFAKAVVNSYYGGVPKKSYFSGCSLGGHQGLTEAAMYPQDFDGIVSGAPSLNWSRLNASRVYINRYVNRSADSSLSPDKDALIHEAVLRACDNLDGVKDGVLEDPRKCHFDPKVLECKAGGSGCLTPAQVQSAAALYSPVISPKTGKQLYPPFMQPGSEKGWTGVAGPKPMPYAREALAYLVYKDPKWDGQNFSSPADVDDALARSTGLTDFDYPTLKPYFDHGGKLLIYHGWSDTTISPIGTVDYFQSISQRLGKSVVGKSIQLYMVPGMEHCGEGEGVNSFDKIGAMEQWMTTGHAPASILASRMENGKVERTRPLCPYGQIAKYKGSGDSNDATNFVCSVEQ